MIGPARSKFYHLIGEPDLAVRFAQPLYTEDIKADLFPILTEALATRTTTEWCRLFVDAGIRHAPVRNYAEVVADDGPWANGYFSRVGGQPVVCAPVRFSATPGSPASTAPELGQHTEEVLIESGFTWKDIARLSVEGAI